MCYRLITFIAINIWLLVVTKNLAANQTITIITDTNVALSILQDAGFECHWRILAVNNNNNWNQYSAIYKSIQDADNVTNNIFWRKGQFRDGV